MAKKYNVTFVNGTEQIVNTKKAVRALEGIAKVTVDGQDITNEFVKEVEVMAENKNIEAIEAEVIEAPAEAEAEAIEEAGPVATILFTASRGNNKKLTWYQVIAQPGEEYVKVRGCAAEVPIGVAEAIGNDKFVAWMPQAIIEQTVIEARQIRGMASTFADVFARYQKVTNAGGLEKVETVVNIFRGILEAIEEGTTTGNWERYEAPEEGINAEIEAIEVA